MGFFSKLFGGRRQRKKESPEDWEQLIFDRDDVDFAQKEQRIGYVTNCLEQIAEATREINLLTGEYSRVTAHLTDMEEIEALPEEEREEIDGFARRLVTLERERQVYRDKKDRMPNSDYYRLRKQEDEIQEGIEKLKECESYGAKIKQDLKRLDRERQAYEYRRSEVEVIMNNLRGMVLIFFTAFVICMIMLLILQFGFEMDTKVGYLMAVCAVCLAITFAWVKYTNEEKELKRVNSGINKIILLQNKVKIRYVNNSNLTDYLYIKYSTDSAAALEKLWECYLQEKEERKQYAEAEAKIEYYQKQLAGKLAQYRVVAPERWLGQPAALLDKREMVEMRHELILRRQALRKQMDYNNNVAETARKEIMGVVNQYPSYGPEIMEMVERFENAE